LRKDCNSTIVIIKWHWNGFCCLLSYQDSFHRQSWLKQNQAKLCFVVKATGV
jgi:hypothetical protein